MEPSAAGGCGRDHLTGGQERPGSTAILRHVKVAFLFFLSLLLLLLVCYNSIYIYTHIHIDIYIYIYLFVYLFVCLLPDETCC